jgi:catechol 2,3-dioxygenase-like lactoylglutathione lyase family enzyme
MLSSCRAVTTLPVSDLAAVRPFYEDVLGLDVAEEMPDGSVLYACGGDTALLVFVSSGSASGTHTQVSFECDDIEAEVADLRGRGVVFEEYDLPGFRTEKGIAELDGERGAWFHDPAGNLLAVAQRTD